MCSYIMYICCHILTCSSPQYKLNFYRPNVAFNSRASFVKASACGESGLPTTVGLPASASEQICGWSGISPNNVMPSSAHFFFTPGKVVSCGFAIDDNVQIDENPPSRPNTSWCVPQFVQVNVLMFCTMPSTFVFVFSKKSMPRTASRRARSCGVETTTAPSRTTDWVMVSCTSPVPGGRSRTSRSSLGHATSKSSWFIAFCTISPRQATGASCGTRKPMLMALRP